jgi:LacI family transcriptional regulator
MVNENTAGVSITDVAAYAGVSTGTVSNVLNRPERVAPATRKRVAAAIADLGFVRNEAARQLRAGRSRTVGLVVLDIGNPFFTDLAAGVEARAAESGLSVVLCNSGEDVERQDRHLHFLREQRAFGILVTPVGARSPAIDAARAAGTAIVLVDRGSGARRCSVSVDDRIGGALAATHLISLGHRSIGFVGGPVAIRQVAERLAGAREAAAAAGLAPESIRIVPTDALTAAEGRRAAERIAALSDKRRPTAVFCANDLLALGVLQEMTKRRFEIPRDLAIVGYDDIEFAAAAAVPLTSVRQPRSQLGRAAMDLLFEEVEAADTHRHRQVVFEPELVVRASTAEV